MTGLFDDFVRPTYFHMIDWLTEEGVMENVERVEAIASANPNQGRRITLDMVQKSIATIDYFHPAEALPDPNGIPKTDPRWLTTCCVCVLKNGWMVMGTTTPADPAMFDKEIGRKLAHEQCVRSIWPMLGFLLRQEMWENDREFGQPHHGHGDAA